MIIVWGALKLIFFTVVILGFYIVMYKYGKANAASHGVLSTG
ncbi:hypothetical protein PsalMR5_04312 (plasmid) [Piscirickettsia salmonis]|nr:hypothetical protein PsalBI1_04173 [Piscirickettsia salmonis]QGP66387.1 hypothetical protein PsalMR5_04312 [Piscirickettsia salmonis]